MKKTLKRIKLALNGQEVFIKECRFEGLRTGGTMDGVVKIVARNENFLYNWVNNYSEEKDLVFQYINLSDEIYREVEVTNASIIEYYEDMNMYDNTISLNLVLKAKNVQFKLLM